MEPSHMLAGQSSPRLRPGDDSRRHPTTMQQPAAPDVDAPTARMHMSPTHGAHEQTSPSNFSDPLDNPMSLQLPPLALSFPEEPTTELAPIQPRHEKCAAPSAPTLPPLSSVTGSSAHAPLPKPPEPAHSSGTLNKPVNHWPSLNPFTTYYTPSYLDPVESSPSMSSDPGIGHRGSSVSLDDPDVRIAAEALGQMRTDCASSPRNQSISKSASNNAKSRDYKSASPSGHNNRPEPEPLLSLITTSHPLLATTIEGAASAYNSGKNYSPHIKTGAEYVESYLKPVGKAVGHVGRKTGVEGGVRWIFGIRSRKQHSSTDIETGERGNSKRRKSDRNDKSQGGSGASSRDVSADGDDRRMSISTIDTLPAYDDQRSPAYTEVADNTGPPTSGADASGQQWGQRFVVTTSGLGVAMKQESLKSLKYCLKVVRDTNAYLNDVLVKLKSVIDAYDQASQARRDEDHAMADGDHEAQRATDDRNRLISRMTELRDDLFRVIHRTVQTVSKYAGSALPENARNLVHNQLMSLPGLYHFHYVRETEGRPQNASPDAGTRDSAHLALLFAREALQMMTQVGDVLNRTLVSAEEWCETLYKKKQEQSSAPLGATDSIPATPLAAADQDTTMSG